MNTNMTGFRCFSKYLRSCELWKKVAFLSSWGANIQLLCQYSFARTQIQFMVYICHVTIVGTTIFLSDKKLLVAEK